MLLFFSVSLRVVWLLIITFSLLCSSATFYPILWSISLVSVYHYPYMMEMFPGARCGTAISMNYVRCAHYVAYRTSLHLQQMWMKREIAEGCKGGCWLFTASQEQFLQLTAYYRSYVILKLFCLFHVSTPSSGQIFTPIPNFLFDTDIVLEVQSSWTSWNWRVVIVLAVASPSLFPFLST